MGLLALRLPYLPQTLDDIDSLNFDLGVHAYDPVAFRPHPPGYPVYVFLAKLAHAAVPDHAAALSLPSAILGAALIVPLFLLMRRITTPAGAALASALTVFNPLVWFSSVRPMSDITGLFATIASQCVLMYAVDDELDARGVSARAGAALAALAVGVRIQAVLLVGPVLVYVWWRRRRQRLPMVGCALAVTLAWLVPLVMAAGGPTRFAGATGLMVRTALPVEPLFQHPNRQRILFALKDELFSPWQTKWLGFVVVALAGAGGLMMFRTNRRGLARLALLFVPYGVYSYLLQDAGTIRYAVPLVPAVALLASIPLSALIVPALGPLSAAALCIVSAVITLPALRDYHAAPSPPFSALARVRQLAADGETLVSGHYMFERYLRWLADDGRIAVLPTAEQEWRVLTDYWRGGKRRPILFLRDSRHTTLLLMGRDSQRTVGHWRWPPSVKRFMRGERPNDVELVRLEPPRWFTDGGIATSFDLGPARDLSRTPHRLFLRPTERRRVFLASGSLVGSARGDVKLRIDDEVPASWAVDQQFTLRALLDPPRGREAYALTLLEASAPALITDVWLGPEDQPAVRPAEGFYVAERDETDASTFRWMAPSARAAVYLPQSRARLTIRGRIPAHGDRTPVRLTFEWEGRPLASLLSAGADFVFQHDLVRTGESPWQDLLLHASASFVPDAVLGNGDSRRVSVRVLEMRLDPVEPSSDQASDGGIDKAVQSLTAREINR